MKPDSNYKMSSGLKTRLSLMKFASAEQRNAWKKAMIQAELESTKKVPLSKDAKANRED